MSKTGKAGVYSLSRHGGDVGHDDLVDEGAEAEPEVGGDVLHGCGEEVAEGGELLLVILHGLGQVHEVVEVHRVILGLGVEEVHVVRLVWKTERICFKSDKSLLTHDQKEWVVEVHWRT